MNRENILNLICELSGKSFSEVESFQNVVNVVMNSIENKVKKKTYLCDNRIEFYCAIKIIYLISSFSNTFIDDTTTFKAGDLSISRNSKSKQEIKSLLISAYSDCIDLINDNEFVVLAV